MPCPITDPRAMSAAHRNKTLQVKWIDWFRLPLLLCLSLLDSFFLFFYWGTFTLRRFQHWNVFWDISRSNYFHCTSWCKWPEWLVNYNSSTDNGTVSSRYLSKGKSFIFFWPASLFWGCMISSDHCKILCSSICSTSILQFIILNCFRYGLLWEHYSHSWIYQRREMWLQ